MERIMTRRPTHPGEIIKAHYLEPLELTVTALAARLGVSRKLLSNLVNGRAAVTVDMALRLSRAFNTTPDLWLNLQRNLDLWEARQGEHPWQSVEPLFMPESQPDAARHSDLP